MSFFEFALRAYILVSAMPVIGFIVLLLINFSSTNKGKRQAVTHADAVQ